MYVAEHYLGLQAEEREIPFSEVKDFAECALCGTAAVLSYSRLVWIKWARLHKNCMILSQEYKWGVSKLLKDGLKLLNKPFGLKPHPNF